VREKIARYRGNLGFATPILCARYPGKGQLALLHGVDRGRSGGGLATKTSSGRRSRMIRTRTLALALTFWFGCATPGTGTLLDTPVETLDLGAFSAIRQRTYVVARTTEEVAALWHAHRGVAPPLIVAGRTVIAVFAGERPTGATR
jgi:hypothetical protein